MNEHRLGQQMNLRENPRLPKHIHNAGSLWLAHIERLEGFGSWGHWTSSSCLAVFGGRAACVHCSWLSQIRSMVLLRHGQTVAPHVSCVCLFGMSLARQLTLRIEAWHGVFGEKQPFKSSCNLQVFYCAEVCSVGCFPNWLQPVLGIAGSVTELKWRLGMWNWETFTANKESQTLEYWEPWGFLSTRSHDDCCNCNRDTKSINCCMYKVCTNMWDPSMKYGPTSWNTKALANDGWCFCSNEVPSGQLFLVPVGKKLRKACACSTSVAF
jgi:hypothetical protein